MKKLIVIIITLFISTNVYATSINSEFEDLYVTAIKGDFKETHPLSVLSITDQDSFDVVWLYKTSFGEVTLANYEKVDALPMKDYLEMYFNNIIHAANELDPDKENNAYYYATQLYIFKGIYNEYNLFITDKDGNIDYSYDDYFAQIVAKRDEPVNEIKDYEIFNEEPLPVIGELDSRSSNLKFTERNGQKVVSFVSGTSGTVHLINRINEGKDTRTYANSDDCILLGGGGEFIVAEDVNVHLKNPISFDLDNPPTGNSPLIYLFVGIPSIIIFCVIYAKISKKIAKS